MITVFYDGKCNLCSREINYYRKIAPGDIFLWHDITRSSIPLTKEGISLSQGLKLLHVKDHEGTIHIGVDAFIVIWKQLKGWRILAAIVALPLVRQGVGMIYRLFASWRFKRLKHCQLAAENDA